MRHEESGLSLSLSIMCWLVFWPVALIGVFLRKKEKIFAANIVRIIGIAIGTPIVLVYCATPSAYADCVKYEKTGECVPIQDLGDVEIGHIVLLHEEKDECTPYYTLEGESINALALMGVKPTQFGYLKDIAYVDLVGQNGFIRENTYLYEIELNLEPLYLKGEKILSRIYLQHPRYGRFIYKPEIVISSVILAADQQMIECKKMILTRQDKRAQDARHIKNLAVAAGDIAIAQAQQKGAEDRKAYFEAQIPILQEQSEELLAIVPFVVAAYNEAEQSLQEMYQAEIALVARRLQYTELMNGYTKAISERATRMLLASEASAAVIRTQIEETRLNQEEIRSAQEQIQLDLNQIESLQSSLQLEIEEAQREWQSADELLRQALQAQVSN